MILLLMGPMGSGKTTVGKLLAERLGVLFLDADDLHPQANRDKMAQGIPLDDLDREPWLVVVREKILPFQREEAEAVLACSALKQKYRDLLSRGTRIRWIYLKGDPTLLETRIKGREGHFASPKILSRQLADLEEPPNALWIDARPEPIILVEEIMRRIADP